MIHFWSRLPTDSIHYYGNHSAHSHRTSFPFSQFTKDEIVEFMNSFHIIIHHYTWSLIITYNYSSSSSPRPPSKLHLCTHTPPKQTHSFPITARNNHTCHLLLSYLRRPALSTIPSLAPRLPPILQSSLHPYTFLSSLPTFHSHPTPTTLYFNMTWPPPPELS